jgi:hypothetical protein
MIEVMVIVAFVANFLAIGEIETDHFFAILIDLGLQLNIILVLNVFEFLESF